MPDEFDVRDDREEAHEEGGDDEVGFTFSSLGWQIILPLCALAKHKTMVS